MQASTPEQVALLIPKMADLVRKYADTFLFGNKLSFEQLSKFREKECELYAIESNLKEIRNTVHEAWRRKDYARIVKLFEPVKEYISEAEYKKLEYSRKQLCKIICE